MEKIKSQVHIINSKNTQLYLVLISSTLHYILRKYVLPVKLDKVKPVKQQFSSIHPEVLLFLSKIR